MDNAKANRRMPDPHEQLVSEITAATGVTPPLVVAGDAPVPTRDAGDLYYVGLIGGKDVGKTSLVNALAGQQIAEPTGHGEGTRSVTAYAHRDVAATVRQQLGDIQIVEHDAENLKRQVLLDLPDIDSKYADHIALTRSMLRFMLYPVWVQSVEKYADQRPQQLLQQVAEGNDPANFIFLLNKCDQLIDREGLLAAGELAEDYGQRLQKRLELKAPPEVLLVSARRPEEYDLPQLRKKLGVQKSAKHVTQSRQLAVARRQTTVMHWVREQHLPARAKSAERLVDDAAELLADRIGRPVLEEALPRLERDAAHRLGLAEPAVRARLRAWPIVNLLDAAFSPLVLLLRKNLAPAEGESAAIDTYLAETGRGTAKNLQAVFAQLNNAYPEVGRLYESRRLWETPAAESAASDLRRRLGDALALQRDAVRRRFTPSPLLAPLRWLLTLGVSLWFVLLQPVAEAALLTAKFEWTRLALDTVQILSAQTLLENIAFVAIYLLVLWATLRFGTYRRVASMRRRLLAKEAERPEASPAAQTVEWMQSLLAPLERRHDELRLLAERAEHLNESVAKAA